MTRYISNFCEKRKIASVLSLKLFITAVAFFLFLKRSWVGEDAFIFFRYVDNFISGQGLVFNIGERVEGFTAFLWVLVLSVFRLLTNVELRPIAMLLGLFLSTLSIFLILLFDNRNKGVFLPIGVLLLITNSAFRDFATSGFETSLTYLLVVLVGLYIKEGTYFHKPLVFGTLLSLLVLNRPEGFLLVIYSFFLLLYRISCSFKNKKFRIDQVINKLVTFSLPVILIVGGYQIFRMGYFAALLPNTFYAKKGGDFYLSQGINYMKDFVFSYPFSIIIILIGVFISFGSIKERSLKSLFLDGRANLIFISVLLVSYVLYSGGDYMHGRSLLMSFMFLCLAINDVFEETLSDKIKSHYTFYVSVVLSVILVFVLNIKQVPVTVTAGKQVNRVNDERNHFGFLLDEGGFSKYFFLPMTAHFGWADRGSYYNEVSKAVDLPISVVMPNIGFFGYTAEDRVNVMGSVLTDVYFSRYPISKRGTVAHENERHYEYIFSRKPTFAYTPFIVWNTALQFRYEEAPHKGIISGDHNDSFIPIFDLSNEDFLQKYSSLVGVDIKSLVDKDIRLFLNNLDLDTVTSDFENMVEFFGFLKLYWVPYTSESDKSIFLQKEEDLLSPCFISSYVVFESTLKGESDTFWNHVTVPINKESFIDNISFALRSLSKKSHVVDKKDVLENINIDSRTVCISEIKPLLNGYKVLEVVFLLPGKESVLNITYDNKSAAIKGGTNSKLHSIYLDLQCGKEIEVYFDNSNNLIKEILAF